MPAFGAPPPNTPALNAPPPGAPPQTAAYPGSHPGLPPAGPGSHPGLQPASDPDRSGVEDEGQATQQWNDEPPAWSATGTKDDPTAAPPARAWELSDTGHSIPPYPSLPEPAQAPRRGKQGLILALLVAALVAGIVGFLGFVEPGFFLVRVLDPAAVQTGVQKVLNNDYGVAADRVICSDGNKVIVDARFECRAFVGEEQFTVPIQVTSESGDYEVSRPVPGG